MPPSVAANLRRAVVSLKGAVWKAIPSAESCAFPEVEEIGRKLGFVSPTLPFLL